MGKLSVKDLEKRRVALRGRLCAERQDLESARSIVRNMNAQKLRGISVSEVELQAQTKRVSDVRARVESLDNEIETLSLAIEQEIEAQLHAALATDTAEAEQDAAQKKKLALEGAELLAALGKVLAKCGAVQLTGYGASDPVSWTSAVADAIGRASFTGSSEWIDLKRMGELISEMRDSAWIDKAQFLRDREEKRALRAREAKRIAAGLPETKPKRRGGGPKAFEAELVEADA